MEAILVRDHTVMDSLQTAIHEQSKQGKYGPEQVPFLYLSIGATLITLKDVRIGGQKIHLKLEGSLSALKNTQAVDSAQSIVRTLKSQGSGGPYVEGFVIYNEMDTSTRDRS